MGKTQLAIAYAKRHRDDYSAIFWLNATDETSLKQGFMRAARRILREYPSIIYIKNAIESHDLDTAVQAVKQWLDNLKNNHWLVIYDNYDNPKLDKNKRSGKETDKDMDIISKGYDIRLFFPEVYHGAVLITTRSSRVEIGHRIPLRKLNKLEESLEILSYTSNRRELHKGRF